MLAACGILVAGVVLDHVMTPADKLVSAKDSESSHMPRTPAAASETEPGPNQREPLPLSPGLLDLECIDGSGSPLAGVVHWHTSAKPLTTSWRLLPQDRLQGGAPFRSTQLSSAGKTQLRIEPGHWTWLRVVDRRSFSVYEHIAPLARLGLAEEAQRSQGRRGPVRTVKLFLRGP